MTSSRAFPRRLWNEARRRKKDFFLFLSLADIDGREKRRRRHLVRLVFGWLSDESIRLLMSVIEKSSSKFAYSISLLSMGDDGREVIGSTSENSSLSEENGKTDYRLSLPSSSQLQSCRLNLNSSISERRKKCLTRIITIVAIFLLVVCILLVTLTLRLAHKIDELVRSKQLMPRPNTFLLVSSTTTTTTPTTTNPPFRRRTTTSSLVH